jgi:hypothetical protein
MANNPVDNYCSKTFQCPRGQYSMVLQANADNGALLNISLVDSCNNLHDHCREQAYLRDVFKQYLVSQGLTADAAEAYVCKDCCFKANCKGSNVGDYYKSTKTMVFVLPTGAAVPAAPVTVSYCAGQQGLTF